MSKTSTLVLVRHGESLWNQENRFTGWQDVDLSPKGQSEAVRGGKALRDLKLRFDIVYTSTLKRAIKTMNLVLEELDLHSLPVIKSWRLNERHYGGLTGLNKSETAAKHGEEQVKIWRRSYDVPPPPMPEDDPRHPKHDPIYKNVNPKDLPNGESLKDTVARFLPIWNESIRPDLINGKNVLIVAHGNSLRALIQNLEKLSAAEIMELNMPTGIPLLYELSLEQNGELKVIRKEFIGDPETVKAAIASVAQQGKAK